MTERNVRGHSGVSKEEVRATHSRTVKSRDSLVVAADPQDLVLLSPVPERVPRASQGRKLGDPYSSRRRRRIVHLLVVAAAVTVAVAVAMVKMFRRSVSFENAS